MSKKIRVIHQSPNIGRAPARNLGMEKSRGEWRCWLDSDDEYSTNYLENSIEPQINFLNIRYLTLVL